MGRKKKRLGTESVEMKDLEMEGLGTKAWGRRLGDEGLGTKAWGRRLGDEGLKTIDILKRRLTNYRS